LSSLLGFVEGTSGAEGDSTTTKEQKAGTVLSSAAAAGGDAQMYIPTSTLRLGLSYATTPFPLDDLLRRILEVLRDDVRLSPQLLVDDVLLESDEGGFEAGESRD
jgi:hypothetical protein